MLTRNTKVSNYFKKKQTSILDTKNKSNIINAMIHDLFSLKIWNMCLIKKYHKLSNIRKARALTLMTLRKVIQFILCYFLNLCSVSREYYVTQ